MASFQIHSVKSFAAKHPAFTEQALRYMIHRASHNGLAHAGAIIRLGRKLVIDESKFLAWIESQNESAA